MHQAVNIPTPTPPPTPTPTPKVPSQGQSFGDQIKGAVTEAVNGILLQTKSELQRKLTQLEERRLQLQATAADNGGNRAARLAIQRQIANTDLEIAETQRALEKIDRQLSGRDGAAQTFSGTTPPPNFGGGLNPPNNFDPTPLVFGVMGILFVAFPLTLAMVRFLWKRASNAPAPAITAEQTRRFDRIEQSVDAIAIEVERISENQRYLTKLLGESKQPAKIGG